MNVIFVEPYQFRMVPEKSNIRKRTKGPKINVT